MATTTVSLFAVGDRVRFDPNWPMLESCRNLGTTGVDQVGEIVRIDPPRRHWTVAVVRWESGKVSPVNLDNLVYAEEAVP